MANERISMRKIRDIIRLQEQGLGYRQIGRALRISHPVVSQYVRDFKATGLSYADITEIGDQELLELLNGGRKADARYGALGTWFERCARELKRVGVTIHQIWEEYRQEQPDGYGYSQFCYHFQVWRDGDEVTMHIEHKVGDKLFVDFAGKKLTVTDPHGDLKREVESFVAVLGASQLGYLQAVETQQKADLIAASAAALDYIGGVPAAIVPDALKSAVTKADPYEPDLNREYSVQRPVAAERRAGAGAVQRPHGGDLSRPSARGGPPARPVRRRLHHRRRPYAATAPLLRRVEPRAHAELGQ